MHTHTYKAIRAVRHLQRTRSYYTHDEAVCAVAQRYNTSAIHLLVEYAAAQAAQATRAQMYAQMHTY